MSIIPSLQIFELNSYYNNDFVNISATWLALSVGWKFHVLAIKVDLDGTPYFLDYHNPLSSQPFKLYPAYTFTIS